eukprot:10884827-Lingulodinium_polyedra.AAC.1
MHEPDTTPPDPLKQLLLKSRYEQVMVSSELKLDRATDPQSRGCDCPTERSGTCKQLHKHWCRGFVGSNWGLV